MEHRIKKHRSPDLFNHIVRNWVRGRLVRISVVSLLTIYLTSCEGNPHHPLPEYDESLYMNIGGWDMPNDAKKMQDLASAGFTILLPHNGHMDFATDPAKASEYLDNALAAGLKVVIRDSDFGEHVWDSALGGHTNYKPADDKNVHLYKDHPAFYGIGIADEPQREQFDMTRRKLEDLRATFPQDKIGFVNICQFRTNFYIDFVDEFMTTVKPSFLSYDDYAMMKDGSIRPSYLRIMLFIKSKAQQYGVPAHQFILSVGHKGESWYRSPSVEDLRWQIACLMTYGYEWFSHFNCDRLDDTYEAMWDDGRNTNALYERIKTANLEVHAWDHVYMSFLNGWEGVAPITGSNGNQDVFFTELLNCNFGNLQVSQMTGIKSIVSNENMLLGAFKDKNGNKGFMATNATNPFNKKNAEATIIFEKSYRRVQVYEFGKPKIYKLDKNQSIILKLSPGEGKFLIPF